MHLVTTTDGTIRFVPRASQAASGAVFLTMYITNEDTRSTSAVVESGTAANNLWTVNPTYTFEEGGNYSLRIKYDNNEIYKGLIFCTDGNTDPFSYNNYTTYDAKDNEYIYR